MASTSDNWRIPSRNPSSTYFNPKQRTKIIKKPINATATATATAVPIHISTKKSKSPKKSTTLETQLWKKVTWVIPFYRCQACHEVMSKKIPSKVPQYINSCEHITCANCIVKSFFVELNPLCPVEGCGKCVNPKDPVAPLPLNILSGDSLKPIDIPLTTSYDNSIDDKILTSSLNDIKKQLDKLLDDSFKEICYCHDRRCNRDCGILSCGCIDICRGRCGNYDRFERESRY